MAQDLKELFEKERQMAHKKMSNGHEERFLQKLENELPVEKSISSNTWFLRIAASVVLFLGLGYATFTMLQDDDPIQKDGEEVVGTTKSLEDISPQLQKVEDYYLANINHELSKIEYSPENKELFDGYVSRLAELGTEYESLSNELINSGPNEDTVTALIDNLKLRLNLLYRLKEKLNELNTETSIEANVL
ncbi:MAG: hypothetical protein ACWA5P_06070 [bacterium]